MSATARPAPQEIGVNSRLPLELSVDVASLMLLVASLAIGYRFWGRWFSETDSIVCSICILFGFGFAVIRGLMFEPVHERRITPWVFLAIAFLLLFYALVSGRIKLTGVSAGLAAAGWLTSRLRGESIAQSLSLGLGLMVPSVVNAFEDRGAFEFVEGAVLNLTSGLSEAMTQFHIQRGDIIEFGHGVADRFSSVGRWDSILPFVGISFFCIFVFRRALVCSLITLSMAFLVWMAVRATAWVAFAWYAEQNGEWITWSLGIEISLFVIGAVLIVLLDQFFAVLFSPIPSEFINEDMPLVSYLWNWVVLLPSLEFSTPKRAKETFDDEADDMDDMEDVD